MQRHERKMKGKGVMQLIISETLQGFKFTDMKRLRLSSIEEEVNEGTVAANATQTTEGSLEPADCEPHSENMRVMDDVLVDLPTPTRSTPTILPSVPFEQLRAQVNALMPIPSNFNVDHMKGVEHEGFLLCEIESKKYGVITEDGQYVSTCF